MPVRFGLDAQRFRNECARLHHDGSLFHSDSLPGVRSVMEAMDSLGFVSNPRSDTMNRTKVRASRIRNRLGEKETGRRGLKTHATANNSPIQTSLPARTACTATASAPARTANCSSLRFSANGCQNRARSNAAMAIHFMAFVSIGNLNSLVLRTAGTEGGLCRPRSREERACPLLGCYASGDVVERRRGDIKGPHLRCA